MGKKSIGKFLLFALMVAAVALALKLIDWIPMSMDAEGMRRYKSIEAAMSALKIKKIYLPSYFPQRIEWPASEVYAQRRPFVVIIMHFKERGTDDILLAIRQADSKALNPVSSRIEPSLIRSEEDVLIKGRTARLSIASCGDGRPCNKLMWNEDGYTLTVVAGESAGELMRIGESMVAE
jgi:hypothetical protein